MKRRIIITILSIGMVVSLILLSLLIYPRYLCRKAEEKWNGLMDHYINSSSQTAFAYTRCSGIEQFFSCDKNGTRFCGWRDMQNDEEHIYGGGVHYTFINNNLHTEPANTEAIFAKYTKEVATYIQRFQNESVIGKKLLQQTWFEHSRPYYSTDTSTVILLELNTGSVPQESYAHISFDDHGGVFNYNVGYSEIGADGSECLFFGIGEYEEAFFCWQGHNWRTLSAQQ